MVVWQWSWWSWSWWWCGGSASSCLLASHAKQPIFLYAIRHPRNRTKPTLRHATSTCRQQTKLQQQERGMASCNTRIHGLHQSRKAAGAQGNTNYPRHASKQHEKNTSKKQTQKKCKPTTQKMQAKNKCKKNANQQRKKMQAKNKCKKNANQQRKKMQAKCKINYSADV